MGVVDRVRLDARARDLRVRGSRGSSPRDQGLTRMAKQRPRDICWDRA
jgi:hypothetical protein